MTAFRPSLTARAMPGVRARLYRMAVVTGVLAGAACAEPQAPTEVRYNRVIAEDIGAPVASYNADIPLAYYDLSLEFTKRTAGFTPPVQARAYAYMGIALYEALVHGMPHHRSVASQ